MTAKSLRVILVVLFTGLAVFMAVAALAGNPVNSDTGKEIGKDTRSLESKFTEENQTRLMSSDQLPQLQDSQERRNLKERLLRLNEANKVGYLALIGGQGQLVAYYTIKGKVSSLNSYLTNTQQIGCTSTGISNDRQCAAVDSPDLDGSYGKNPEGIFFFTTDNTMIEWSGDYLYSDKPLSYTSKPVIVESAQ